ncbi:MAG TPA: UDP-N-acetylmuramoyl-tripeptide--D-alanyl-D-alanine ligase [Rikenellaceae bacterium]|nr:UDP-N-acetylmuramoyl-tripeptide--D-alanyl-D-alanine ligase [Rikenellaceae bacterium]
MPMTAEELYRRYCDCDCHVTTDSRQIKGGEMFFALKGDSFDGNDYVLAALEAGACYAVADRSELPDDERIIKVEDSYATLRDLAVWHRTHVKGGALPVIGLTGTNGKTTTKNLISLVLACKYRVTATQGNFNNDIGVPLSLLSIRPDTEIAVIEMGANHPDDIAKLVRVSQPDYGLITNVGKAHLLGFGSFEGVVAAKTELYKWLGGRKGSLIFLNEDDPVLKDEASKQPCHCFGYGVGYQGAKVLPATAEVPFLRIELDGKVISTHLIGAYNAPNVMAALAVGDYFGVPREEAVNAIESFEPDNKRSEMRRTGKNVLIVDAYNANPTSMAAALDSFFTMLGGAETPGIALLGEMRELGADSLREHASLLRRLSAPQTPSADSAKEETAEASGTLECVMLVGDEFRKALDDCGLEYGVVEPEGLAVRMEHPACKEECQCHSESVPRFVWAPSSECLCEFLRSCNIEGYLILLKGSRGTQMEKVIPAL